MMAFGPVKRIKSLKRREFEVKTDVCRSSNPVRNGKRCYLKKVVKPSVKKEVSKYLRKKYKVSISSICMLLGITRNAWYYTSKLDDTEIIEKLKDCVENHPNRGFDNYFKRMRREGFNWSGTGFYVFIERWDW